MYAITKMIGVKYFDGGDSKSNTILLAEQMITLDYFFM